MRSHVDVFVVHTCAHSVSLHGILFANRPLFDAIAVYIARVCYRYGWNAYRCASQCCLCAHCCCLCLTYGRTVRLRFRSC
jgi:hypothetical protein